MFSNTKMIKRAALLTTALLSASALAACGGNDTKAGPSAAATDNVRNQIKIVGSSTVFPFSTAVAERFGQTTDFKTPLVESTGSGGGLKLFCAGKGDKTPDITNASRRIKSSEIEKCAANGVGGVVEVKIGYDGIVIANSRKSAQVSMSLRDVFLALAKEVPGPDGAMIENPYTTWKDVNPALKDVRIEVLGPPPTSGTRDAFVELAMEGGCKTFPEIKAMKKTNKSAYKALCHTLREDGGFIEAGENDNLIVQKLTANPNAMGIFGYSFLDQNSDTTQASVIDGVPVSYDSISDGSYPVSRSLYFYAKKDHMGRIPGLTDFLEEFISDKASGPTGYLADKGLIAMGPAERAEWKTKVSMKATIGQ